MILRSADSAFEREATTDERGAFRLDELLPGVYRVTVQAAGFSPAEADVLIVVATVRDITVAMKLAPLLQTLKVEAETSSITTQATDLTSAVHQGGNFQPGP